MRVRNIHRLIQRGDVAGVKAMLAANPHLANHPEYELSSPPLLTAINAEPSDPEMVKALLEAGADPNVEFSYDEGSPLETPIASAIKSGNPDVVRLLIDAGVPLDYPIKPKQTCRAGLEAANSKERPRLLELLDLMCDHGVDFEETTPEDAPWGGGSFPLRQLSALGRFEAVKLLVDRGAADAARMKWTPVMKAVIFGTADDLRREIRAGSDLGGEDASGRTAMDLAILTGEPAKADLLHEAGVEVPLNTPVGNTSLAMAIWIGKPEMVRWVLDHLAIDITTEDEWGGTPFDQAAELGNIAVIRTLLEAAGHKAPRGALRNVEQLKIALLLIKAGADPRDLPSDARRYIFRAPGHGRDDLADLSEDEYARAKRPRMGTSNPEEVREPYYTLMIGSRDSAFGPRCEFGDEARFMCGEKDPVWCADRFGQSLTPLPDGRIVEIAGEHEDHYDPDFCIYNDVFVHEPGREVRVFLYPREVFPPTDFHSATLVEKDIIVIGSLGYGQDRRAGFTPVYRLDTNTFAMEPLPTTGDNPGWIHGHRAVLDGDDIIICGGEVSQLDYDLVYNPLVWRLNLPTLSWRRSDEAPPFNTTPRVLMESMDGEQLEEMMAADTPEKLKAVLDKLMGLE